MVTVFGMLKHIFLITPVYITLIWAIILLISDKSKSQPKVFLGFFMLVASTIYISHFFYFTNNIQAYLYIDSIYTLTYLMVYPMYNVYVRLLTIDQRLTFRKHFLHFVGPLLLFALTLLGYSIMGKEKGMEYIQRVLVDGEKASGIHKYMLILFIAGRVTFFVQTLTYLVLSFNLIRKNDQKLRKFYSNINNYNLNWVNIIGVCLAITSISSAILASVGRNVFLQNEMLLLFPSIIFSSMLFVVGFLGNNQKMLSPENEKEFDIHDQGVENYKLKSKIDVLFDIEKIYKQPNLTIWNVSYMLGTNRKHVLHCIEKEYGRDFFNHVNHYRVQHSKRLINSNRNLSNEQIAELSGFDNINSLYKTFQEFENIQFENYRKQFPN